MLHHFGDLVMYSICCKSVLLLSCESFLHSPCARNDFKIFWCFQALTLVPGDKFTNTFLLVFFLCKRERDYKDAMENRHCLLMYQKNWRLNVRYVHHHFYFYTMTSIKIVHLSSLTSPPLAPLNALLLPNLRSYSFHIPCFSVSMIGYFNI